MWLLDKILDWRVISIFTRASASPRSERKIDKAGSDQGARQNVAQRVCDKLPGELRNEVYRHLISTSVRNSISNAPIPVVDFRTRTITKQANEQLHEESEHVFKLELLRLFDHKAAGMILPSGQTVTWAYLPDNPDDRHSTERLYLGVPVRNLRPGTQRRFLPGEAHFWMSPQLADVVRFTCDQPGVRAIRGFRVALRETLAHEKSSKNKDKGLRVNGAIGQLVKRLMDLVDLILAGYPTDSCPELPTSSPPAREMRDRILQRWPGATWKWAYGEQYLL